MYCITLHVTHMFTTALPVNEPERSDAILFLLALFGPEHIEIHETFAKCTKQDAMYKLFRNYRWGFLELYNERNQLREQLQNAANEGNAKRQRT